VRGALSNLNKARIDNDINRLPRCTPRIAASPYRFRLGAATNCGIIAAPLTQEALVREQLSMITTGVVFAFLGAIVIGVI
jgi:hypothetical protein